MNLRPARPANAAQLQSQHARCACQSGSLASFTWGTCTSRHTDGVTCTLNTGAPSLGRAPKLGSRFHAKLSVGGVNAHLRSCRGVHVTQNNCQGQPSQKTSNYSRLVEAEMALQRPRRRFPALQLSTTYPSARFPCDAIERREPSQLAGAHPKRLLKPVKVGTVELWCVSASVTSSPRLRSSDAARPFWFLHTSRRNTQIV